MIALNITDLWRFQLKTSTSYLHNWYKIKPDTRETYIFITFSGISTKGSNANGKSN